MSIAKAEGPWHCPESLGGAGAWAWLGRAADPGAPPLPVPLTLSTLTLEGSAPHVTELPNPLPLLPWGKKAPAGS